ncbi:MAG TPA: hypothetical protein VFN35_36740, partial [Ktedonobacteraceae bacterium]|nr:hypothetical protein [Ktedonobacteraceae bacterium]
VHALPAGSTEHGGEQQKRLLLAGQLAHEPWEEGIEREVGISNLPLQEILARPRCIEIAFDDGQLVAQADHTPDMQIIRKQQRLTGTLTIAAERLTEQENLDSYRLSVHIENTTLFNTREEERRDAILLQAFISTHTILRVSQGNFLSLIDPPEPYKAAAQRCKNTHTWPVLVGEPGERDTLLSSPIILYDYPEIAPESPGALFDGTEIDEILALRILTLSDEEKAEIRQGDGLARELLERVESLTPEQFWQLHGTIRERRPLEAEMAMPDPTQTWPQAYGYPGEDYPPPTTVRLAGKEARVGDRVRLHPNARADVFDIVLAGKTARIEALQQDFENRLYLVVTIDDDPGREQWDERVLPGHRFFFFPEEVELLEEHV